MNIKKMNSKLRNYINFNKNITAKRKKMDYMLNNDNSLNNSNIIRNSRKNLLTSPNQISCIYKSKIYYNVRKQLTERLGALNNSYKHMNKKNNYCE